MNFEMSEEQRMLTDSLHRYLRDQYGAEVRRSVSRGSGAFRQEAWTALAEMGILGLCIEPEYGGYGESAAAAMLVQHELGRELVSEPVTPSAVMAAAVLQRYGTSSQKEGWLPAIAEGRLIVTLAHLEPGQRYAQEPVATTAKKNADGFMLNGSKTLVWHAGVSNAILLLAQLDASNETAMFFVPAGTHGLSCVVYPTVDGMCAGDVSLSDVAVPLTARVGADVSGHAVLQWGLDHGIAALCAEAGGVMEHVIELTSEYLKMRQQFGVPLGAFQALQHRMADMLIQKELAISMAHVAAQALSDSDQQERSRKLSAAKYMMAKAARYVGQQAIQLHGGMGMTEELVVGDYFKRLMALGSLLGDGGWHLNRYGELMTA